MNFPKSKKLKILLTLIITIAIFTFWQLVKQPATTGDWQTQLAIPSVATIDGNSVTIKNVRNFRYGPAESDMHPAYYDQTYDLTKLKKVWYVTEPFNGQEYAAHTFVSFEFEDEKFVSITIEARKTKDQQYSSIKGLFRTYPLIYIAADERDVIMLRANLRKDKVYLYPIKTTKENGQKLFLDMLKEMNKLPKQPSWYHTLFANCTSRIATHVNHITPGRISWLSWQLWATGSADELALKKGLLDTDLNLEEARNKFYITDKSQKIGDTESYSKLLRAE